MHTAGNAVKLPIEKQNPNGSTEHESHIVHLPIGEKRVDVAKKPRWGKGEVTKSYMATLGLIVAVSGAVIDHGISYTESWYNAGGKAQASQDFQANTTQHFQQIEAQMGIWHSEDNRRMDKTDALLGAHGDTLAKLDSRLAGIDGYLHAKLK